VSAFIGAHRDRLGVEPVCRELEVSAKRLPRPQGATVIVARAARRLAARPDWRVPFHGKPNTDSTGSRTAIPRQAEQFRGRAVESLAGQEQKRRMDEPRPSFRQGFRLANFKPMDTVAVDLSSQDVIVLERK
jgi:hypothetical protein